MRQIVEISGVGQVLAASCAEKGFRTVEDIAAAKVADLVAVPGVSIIRANQLIQAAQTLLRNASQPETIVADNDSGASEADTFPLTGTTPPRTARVTNGAGDQIDSAKSSNVVSVLPREATSSAKSGPAQRDDVKTKKKKTAKTAKKKRTDKEREKKKDVRKKSKKKKKGANLKGQTKSKKSKKTKGGKKAKSRREKRKSEKSK